MDIESYFSANYPDARARFLQICQAQGFAIHSYQNDRAQAPDGSDLFMDVASLGPADASRLLVLFSGTHGVEGYCGSGIQAALELADGGHQVYLVEKEPSIGGLMAALDKTDPTMDCSI